MSIDKAGMVDAIGMNPESGAVHMTIADHLEWDQQHLAVLQDKLNTYLAFIESGEIFVTYPDAGDRDIQINVLMKFRPTRQALEFLRQAEQIIEDAGILFEFGPLPDGYAEDNG